MNLPIRLKTAFPENKTQICVLHQTIRPAGGAEMDAEICNMKRQKAFTSDMKNIYNAPTIEAAGTSLKDFGDVW